MNEAVKKVARRAQASTVRDRLAAGELVDDRIFDDVYPPSLRRISHMHWTPIEAAMRASKLLECGPGARVLDIGSGVGKFCIVAAAATGARVFGVERRRGLIEVAEETAAWYGVDVSFVHGSFASCDPSAVDGVYLFNPFVENISAMEDRIDSTVELSERRFVDDVAAAEEFLRSARAGTRVVTYCGFGGDMPPDYVRVLRERRAGVLELWIKTDGS